LGCPLLQNNGGKGFCLSLSLIWISGWVLAYSVNEQREQLPQSNSPTAKAMLPGCVQKEGRRK